MAVYLHEEDLPADVRFADGPIAIDTEAMGLVPGRDRLCLVQLSDGKGDEHLVRFRRGSDYSAPNLKALLSDSNRLKLYHFARFDVGIMKAYLGITAAPALLHPDGVAPGADVHGPARAEGSGQGVAEHRSF